jgi:hypothetical protein
MRPMPILRRASRATVFALSLGVALGAVYLPGAPGESQARAQRSRPLTKKERQKRKEQEEAAKKEQEKKDAEAAAAAEEEEKKKTAAATTTATPATPAPATPQVKDGEWDDTVESENAIFVTADLGYTRADMSTFAASSMAFDHGSANGLLIGLTGGLRKKEWAYGLRYRVYDTSDFTLWSFSASVSYALKPRPVTPIIEGHLGYIYDQSIERAVFESSLPPSTVLKPDVDVKGVLLGGEGSANYWLTTWFRVGAFIGIDFMFLSRAKAPLPQSTFGPTPESAELPLFKDSGFGIGFNVNAGLRGSFEIGIE